MTASRNKMHQKRMSHRRHPHRIPSSRSRSLTPVSVKPSSRDTSAHRSQRRRRSSHLRKSFTSASHASPSQPVKKHLVSPPPSQTERRARWAAIAQETRRIVLGDGKYVQARACALPRNSPSPSSNVPASFADALDAPIDNKFDIVHDIGAQIELSRQSTTVFPHYSEMLAGWRIPTTPISSTSRGTFEFSKSCALTSARYLSPTSDTIGVLVAASPKKCGGSYLLGADDPEARLARSSSLSANLDSPFAAAFYQEHRRISDKSGLRDHSLVYCPGVVVFHQADDDKTDSNIVSLDTPPIIDSFIAPYKIDVLAAASVNAFAVRSHFNIAPEDAAVFADGIRTATKERVARALRLFEERGVRTLVLPAFGSEDNMGVPVDDIAAIWAELLVCGDGEGPARFEHSFDKIVFAVPGRLHDPFRQAFDMRVFEAEVARAMDD